MDRWTAGKALRSGEVESAAGCMRSGGQRAVGCGGAGLGGGFFLSYHWNIRKRADLGSLGGQTLMAILLFKCRPCTGRWVLVRGSNRTRAPHWRICPLLLGRHCPFSSMQREKFHALDEVASDQDEESTEPRVVQLRTLVSGL